LAKLEINFGRKKQVFLNNEELSGFNQGEAYSSGVHCA
jgi:hypothetical protein